MLVSKPQSGAIATEQETGAIQVAAADETQGLAGPSCATAAAAPEVQALQQPGVAGATVQPKPEQQPAPGDIRCVPAPLSPLQQHELSASFLEAAGATDAVAGIASKEAEKSDAGNVGEDCCGCVGAAPTPSSEPLHKRRKAADGAAIRPST